MVVMTCDLPTLSLLFGEEVTIKLRQSLRSTSGLSMSQKCTWYSMLGSPYKLVLIESGAQQHQFIFVVLTIFRTILHTFHTVLVIAVCSTTLAIFLIALF